MGKKIISISIFLLGCIHLIAQEYSATETLKKVEAYYKNTEVFDVEMEYKMFRGFTGNNITESYKGTMYKKGAVSRIEILGSEILFLPEAKITIDNEKKTVRYQQLKNDVLQGTPIDILSFLKFYKAVSTKLYDDTIIQEMVQKNPQVPLPYNKIVLYITKDTYQIKKQELYFATQVPFVDKNGKGVPDAARMEISFKPNPKPLRKVPQLKHYLQISSNNTITLSPYYANYSVIN